MPIPFSILVSLSAPASALLHLPLVSHLRISMSEPCTCPYLCPRIHYINVTDCVQASSYPNSCASASCASAPACVTAYVLCSYLCPCLCSFICPLPMFRPVPLCMPLSVLIPCTHTLSVLCLCHSLHNTNLPTP